MLPTNTMDSKCHAEDSEPSVQSNPPSAYQCCLND